MKRFQSLEARLVAAGNGNAKRSVEELAAHAMGCRPLEIYFRDMTDAQATTLDEWIVRAEDGEPIQYIIGTVDFRGVDIGCDPRALIPRPETELLVEAVMLEISNIECRMSKVEGQRSKVKGREGLSLSNLKPQASSLKPSPSLSLHIADVCTGTGCVGLALLAELPDAEVIAIDLSSEALALAQENADRLGFSDRFEAVQGDLLAVDAMSSSHSLRSPCDEKGDGLLFKKASLDIVVSNPPYILSGAWETLEPCVRDREPRMALDGGVDGMDLIRPLVEQSAQALKPGGGLFIEMGYDQGLAVVACFEAAGFREMKLIQDYAGLDRIVCGRKRG